MNSTKPWYLSLSVWISMIQAIFGILLGAGALPDVFSGNSLVGGGVVTGLAAAQVAARVRATKQITATDETQKFR